MRLTTDRRTGLALLAGAILISAGCKDRPAAGTGGTGSGTGHLDSSGGPTLRQAADSFLTDLADGKAAPSQLTGAFRADIAPPMSDEDKKAGYSESAARDWLARFKGANFIVRDADPVGDAIVLRGRAQVPGQAEAFTLRMVKGPTGYLCDWLHRSTIIGSDLKSPADPDLAAAQNVVRDFLDLLLGGDHRQAHALMTLDWKKKLAPPPPAEARKGAEFDRGFLTQTTRSWKGDYVGYTLSKQELGPNKDSATFTAELEAEGRKTSYTVRATKDKATGWWLVAAFDKQQS
jgi:hypothetical protein